MNGYTISPSIHYLLLDMDGTLVNTEPVGPETFVEQLSKYGIVPTESQKELFLKVWRRDGTNINEKDFLTSIVREHAIDTSPDKYISEFFTYYEANIIKAKALPGVNSFLAKASGGPHMKLAIVTASKSSQVNAILAHQGWSKYFDAIVSEEDFTKHKPDPQPFMIGLKKLGANSSACLVFEDSRNGALAGKAAGCTVIGIRAGNAMEQDLSTCDAIVQTFNSIIFA